MTVLRLILGDQLNSKHSWFQRVDANTVYCLFEMRQETDYAKHHIQKVAGFFAAMRAFANDLQAAGHQVVYFTLSDKRNTQSLTSNLDLLIKELGATHFEYLLPDEYRLDEQLKTYCAGISITHRVYDTEHFLSTRNEVETLFAGKKQTLMETFYREMRKRYGLLMEGKDPTGGKWNYDAENRQKWKGTPAPPAVNLVVNDVTTIVQEIRAAGVETIGNIDPTAFNWPVTRKQALELLDYFNAQSLPFFGQFQDAMSERSTYLFHSRLSFALNTKLISPLEVVQSAIAYWEAHQALVTLPQIEGFVRQIIGWREYMRGIYWWKMPSFATLNFFNHERPLPHYFWDGDTQMNCVRNAVQNSLDQAYAHHIQRLMVTGNFALLAGIHPDEVDAWYLGIYIDAIEWVEITNTRGMSQYADGGIVGSKPYISSANYMDKMSDYCGSCHYNKQLKYGEGACPFNSLYWHFYARNEALLGKNPRIGMMYNVLRKMEPGERNQILNQAERYLEDIESL